jgi:hypothetical protein
MLKKITSIMLSTLAMLAFSFSAFAATGGNAQQMENGDPQTDIAKMYRIKHEMKFNLLGTKAILDGQAIQANKAIMKNGRVFVPLRTLRESGAAASVTWNSKKKEVRVVMKAQVSATWKELSFYIGKDQIYKPDGEPLSPEKIPVPFLENAITYIPIKTLSWLGMSASTEQGFVSLNWSEKIIEVLEPSWKTEGEETTFSMLFQQDMPPPQFLSSLGVIGWAGGSGKITQKDISLDGRVFNRMEFTVGLRPGINPLQLTAISVGTADVSVLRQVPSDMSVPVSLTEVGKLYLSLDAPSTGYVVAKEGEKLQVAGTILQENANFDKVTLVVQKLYPTNGGLGHQEYESVDTKEVVIKNNHFLGTLTLNGGQGYYLITINSPKYIPFPESRLVATQWAEFVVEVKE